MTPRPHAGHPGQDRRRPIDARKTRPERRPPRAAHR